MMSSHCTFCQKTEYHPIERLQPIELNELITIMEKIS